MILHPCSTQFLHVASCTKGYIYIYLLLISHTNFNHLDSIFNSGIPIIPQFYFLLRAKPRYGLDFNLDSLIDGGEEGGGGESLEREKKKKR